MQRVGKHRQGRRQMEGERGGHRDTEKGVTAGIKVKGRYLRDGQMEKEMERQTDRQRWGWE